MRTLEHASLRTATFMVVMLGAFHIARPVAVSAQASASLRVSATVVRADAAWSGHEMTLALARSLASEVSAPSPTGAAPEAARALAIESLSATGARMDVSVERNGAIAWMEPAASHASGATVTVAHLGS